MEKQAGKKKRFSTGGSVEDSASVLDGRFSLSGILKERRDAGDTTLAAGVDGAILKDDISRLVDLGLDLLEVRLDHFKKCELSDVVSLLNKIESLPIIATIRSSDEGGKWSGTEQDRIELFKALASHVNAVDIELKSLRAIEEVSPVLQAVGTELLLSFHDFEKTPTIDELKRVVAEAIELGADIVKIATYINDVSDNKILAELLATSECESLIVIGMGPLGASTRISFPSLGSLLTFCSVEGLSTAPGQIPLLTMMDTLRVLFPKFNERKNIDMGPIEYI